jgi:PPM family protein phosphatase
MKFSIYQESLLGGRKMNQDRMGYAYSQDSLIMIMADGMGGHLHGEIASQITVQSIAEMFQRVAKPKIPDPAKFFEDSFFIAHRTIDKFRQQHKLTESPRTTVVACIIQDGRACWAHAGDSRLYWIRAGKVHFRTKDHSKVQMLIDQGLLAPHMAAVHPERSKVMNCLGSPNLPHVDISAPQPISPGDVFMLCSDGLWGPLPDREIGECFAEQSVMKALPFLLKNAVETAGEFSDNTTAIAARWEGTPILRAVEPQEHTTDTNNLDIAMTTVLEFPPTEIATPEMMDDIEIHEAIQESRSALDTKK